MERLGILTLVCAITTVLTEDRSFGQTEPPSAQGSHTTAAADWFAYYRRRAAEDYELTFAGQDTPLSLRQQSILNWTNPLEDGQINGSTFVWEHEGRPIAIGQLFSYIISDSERSLCHVFTTLSDESVTGRRLEQEFWLPPRQDRSGWHEATMLPTPAKTRPARLAQMRQLARTVEAYTDEKTRGKRNLRFLPQPLYRFDVSNEDADGAIFAYVVGNDPELLIAAECELPNATRWRYRFAQSTRSTTVALLDGLEVYRHDGATSDPASPTAVYLSEHGIERIPGELRPGTSE